MNHPATNEELRKFGLLVGGVFAVIGIWPLGFRGEPLRWWAIILGGILIVFGALLPQILAPIHRGWMWAGHVLGWVNTRILLGVVFYGLITPIGLLFRLIGKDPLRQALAEESLSFRIVKSPRPRSHMKYQF